MRLPPDLSGRYADSLHHGRKISTGEIELLSLFHGVGVTRHGNQTEHVHSCASASSVRADTTTPLSGRVVVNVPQYDVRKQDREHGAVRERCSAR